MDKYKYVILGGGPAGLTFANKLLQLGEKSFVLLEAENEAGGLCRSKMVDGAPLDIGGGHFLDVRRPKVNEFLFKFMPEDEWDKYNRDSRIEINGIEVSHPIEANIWQMPIEMQVDYLKSVAVAGCNQGKEMPREFVDWIFWKLGERIANDYMIPYNKKIFSKNLNELGTYWLEKLPNVSFEETLRSCLEHKAYGTQPGHAQFYYPKKYGYGELWLRMAKDLGDNVIYNSKVNTIDFNTMTVRTDSGMEFAGEKIITTIPWKSIDNLTGMPEELHDDIKELKHSSVQIEYHKENMDTEAHWIYYPSEELSYHRILVRHNFCPNSSGYWTETNCERAQKGDNENSYDNEYAYPLNTINKPEIMSRLISWCEGKQVYPLGRWGEHQHYNSDVTVMRAMELYERISRKG